MKSKSVTNLAEATADPALELDAGGNPIAPPTVAIESEEAAIGLVQPSANEPYPDPIAQEIELP